MTEPNTADIEVEVKALMMVLIDRGYTRDDLIEIVDEAAEDES